MAKRFSDFCEEHKPLDGDKLKIAEVIDREIEIIGFKISPSKYHERNVLTLQFNLNNDKYIIFTGSVVIMSQVEKYKNELPFMATIRKINKYYTLS